MHKFNRIRQVAPMCPHGRTCCHHLSNNIWTIRLRQQCAWCQITLTTWHLWTCPLRQSHR